MSNYWPISYLLLAYNFIFCMVVIFRNWYHVTSVAIVRGSVTLFSQEWRIILKNLEDDVGTDLNTPYDYESIMHYRPLSFNKNESIPTITTIIPYFNDIIGQRQDFSAVDITRLNRMYDCGESLFLHLQLVTEKHQNKTKTLENWTH